MTDFAKIANVSAGTKLIADDGFTCIKPKAEITVFSDDQGRLYIPCSHGKHYLDGQADGDIYIGLSPAA